MARKVVLARPLGKVGSSEIDLKSLVYVNIRYSSFKARNSLPRSIDVAF